MPVRRILALAALTVLYFAAGRLGLSLAFVNASASAIWPPTGLAIAAGVFAGLWIWPAVFVGAFLVNLTTTSAVFPSLLIACGNTIEAVIVAAVVRSRGGGPAIFAKTSGILAYLAAAMAAAALGATVGITALLAGGLAETSGSAMIWLTWLTGDFSSAVLLAPTMLAAVHVREEHWTPGRALEAVTLVAIVLIAAYWVFGPTVPGIRNYPLMFVMLPLLLWAAMRFGLPGATTAVLLTGVAATLGTLSGVGPFARGTPNESLLLLQAYLDVKMVVMLTLAAAVVDRRRIEHDIRQLNLDLERRIESRSEDLRRLHGRLVEAQTVAHIGSWEWDMIANSVWWSDEMYRVYGQPVGSPITYERFLSLVHPDDRTKVHEIVAASAGSGDAFTFEHRAVKPDGTIVTLYSRGRVMTDDAGRAIRMLGIGHDITERKRAEEERVELAREQAARREAEEANRMKDYFLATLSHELRTPLNALMGWAHVLKKTTDDEQLRTKAVDAIQRNVSIQAQLVSDIFDVARIRSGALSIDARPASLKAIVDGALEIMRPVFTEKAIEVIADLPDDAIVLGDARRLQQVCWNILSNSAKFLEPGGRIGISARQDGDTVALMIEDNGPGIPEDFLPFAFDQFRQADASVTRQHGGLGLGLAISRDLVQLHGGTIVAANRSDGGALFTVRLPSAKPEPSAMQRFG
jgi:signal transduction histidine kinase/integral membrane sensor domain MASE1